MFQLNLDNKSYLPKYKQIITAIELAIAEGELKKGDALPSINSIRDDYNLSRDTVLMAYNDLKARGIIQSIVGKGYYVQNENIEIDQKIFVLFDELNSFKEDLYHSFISNLESSIRVDIFFHHFNAEMFSKLIYENNGNYNYYVIMPANLKNIELPISILPQNKVYLLDQTRESLATYAAVYQNFEKNIFDNLTKAIPQLIRYSSINLVFSEKKQPLGMKIGFERFCKTRNLNYKIIDSIAESNVAISEAYIIPEDKDLLKIIQITRKRGLSLCEHIGVISYNDTLLKEIVEGGITTISTDFKQMGVLLAQMIQSGSYQQVENPDQIIMRNSI